MTLNFLLRFHLASSIRRNRMMRRLFCCMLAVKARANRSETAYVDESSEMGIVFRKSKEVSGCNLVAFEKSGFRLRGNNPGYVVDIIDIEECFAERFGVVELAIGIFNW